MKKVTFYQRLEQLQRSSKKSFNQIEKDLGYPRNALNNYKLGGIPSGKRLLEMAEYFNVTPDYLLGIKKTLTVPSLSIFFEKLELKEKMEMCELCQKWLFTLIHDFKLEKQESNEKGLSERECI